MSEYNVFGKKSYEFAVGAIKASSHAVLSDERWNRLHEADLSSAEKMLAEFGYPASVEGKGINSSIDAEMSTVTSMVRELAPDEELTKLLFFEEDALNLKLYLKAKMIGKAADKIKPAEGGISPEILRACVTAEDYSLLGAVAEGILSGIENESNPGKVSCIADNAMFAHAVSSAKRKHCEPLVRLLLEYGKGKNRLTAMRMRRLGFSEKEHEYAFLPADFSDYREKDKAAEPFEIIEDVNSKIKAALSELGFGDGMGVIAQYYFTKKNEAAALRLLFAEKSLEERNGGSNN